MKFGRNIPLVGYRAVPAIMNEPPEPRSQTPPPSPAEAAQNSLRRILWSLQELARSSLPEIPEEGTENFPRRLNAWDELCKGALGAETALGERKGERTLAWLESAAKEFELLAQPAAAPGLAGLASGLENAARLWEKLTIQAARDAGTALWLERAWGLALDILSARVSTLASDDRKRILEERISELRARRQAGNKILAAGDAAGMRPLRKRRLAKVLSRLLTRQKNGFREAESQIAARAAAAEERAQTAEAGALSRDREIETLRKGLKEAGARADYAENRARTAEQLKEISESAAEDLARQLQESRFQHESFIQQARAVEALAGARRSEAETLRKKVEAADMRSTADSDLIKETESRLKSLQEDVQALQELLKQADEQSASMLGRALAAEEANGVLGRELESIKERLPAAEGSARNPGERVLALEAELAASQTECAELRRSREAEQAGESARLRADLERSQARLAKLTAEFEALIGPRLPAPGGSGATLPS